MQRGSQQVVEQQAAEPCALGGHGDSVAGTVGSTGRRRESGTAGGALGRLRSAEGLRAPQISRNHVDRPRFDATFMVFGWFLAVFGWSLVLLGAIGLAMGHKLKTRSQPAGRDALPDAHTASIGFGDEHRGVLAAEAMSHCVANRRENQWKTNGKPCLSCLDVSHFQAI